MDNMRGRGRGGRRGRGMGRGGTRGGARRKKSIDVKDENVNPHEDEVHIQEQQQQQHLIENQSIPKLDMEADISQLEAPTFTTLSRGPPEAMLRLQWGHPVNLVGEKVLNPMIHCCDQCGRPVLNYGRMIPCKHVFCFACAKRDSKLCARCNEKVIRVEQTGLGTVFMCIHGGTRYGNTGCGRTYLSQRDLQAHINHRHVTSNTPDNMFTVKPPPTKPDPPRGGQPVQLPPGTPFYDGHKKMYEDPHGDPMAYASPRSHDTAVPPPNQRLMPPLRPQGNLITVPLQQEPPPEPYYPNYNTGYSYPPPTGYQDYPPPQPDTCVPPPQPWNNTPFYG